MDRKNIGSEELVFDYKMFEDISKDINKHYKNIIAMRKNLAQNKKVSVMLKAGIIESLTNIIEHMEKARSEIDNAKKEIKKI